MTDAHLKVIVTPNKEANARRVVARLNEIVKLQNVEFSTYHKGGFEMNASIEIGVEKWSDNVVALLEIAQKFGRSWMLCGHIKEEINLTCTDFSISGLEFATLTLDVSEWHKADIE